MIVLYIVILIYFNFNITFIVNAFMLSIEKKRVLSRFSIRTWKYKQEYYQKKFHLTELVEIIILIPAAHNTA